MVFWVHIEMFTSKALLLLVMYLKNKSFSFGCRQLVVVWAGKIRIKVKLRHSVRFLPAGTDKPLSHFIRNFDLEFETISSLVYDVTSHGLGDFCTDPNHLILLAGYLVREDRIADEAFKRKWRFVAYREACYDLIGRWCMRSRRLIRLSGRFWRFLFSWKREIFSGDVRATNFEKE